MEPLLAGALAIGAFAILSGGKRGGSGGIPQQRGPQATLLNPSIAMRAMGMHDTQWPLMPFNIPFAAGVSKPVWPIVTNHSKKFEVCYRALNGDYFGNSSRYFMSKRSGGRYHSGVDLYGNPGDPILAMEDGVITNHYHFYHGTYALFVQCDSGLVINYSEVKNESWKEFGLSIGSRVRRGQPIARVGLMTGGSHMCHFETYMPPTDKNKKYFGGEPGPILNPTYYLLLARHLSTSGKIYAGVDCAAQGILKTVPVPADLEWVKDEDERVNEKPGDSALPELLIEDMWRPEKDEGFGP